MASQSAVTATGTTVAAAATVATSTSSSSAVRGISSSIKPSFPASGRPAGQLAHGGGFVRPPPPPPPPLAPLPAPLTHGGSIETVVVSADFEPELKPGVLARDRFWTDPKAFAAFPSSTGPSYLTTSEYAPTTHAARVLHFPRLRSEAFIFPSGRVTVVATRRGEAETLALLAQCVTLVAQLGGTGAPALSTTRAVVSHVDVVWSAGAAPALATALAADLLWLDKLALRFPALRVVYAPTILPAAVVQLQTSSALLVIFESGRVLAAARTSAEAVRALRIFLRVYVERAVESEAAAAAELAALGGGGGGGGGASLVRAASARAAAEDDEDEGGDEEDEVEDDADEEADGSDAEAEAVAPGAAKRRRVTFGARGMDDDGDD